jgi:hypothetical protein
MGTIPIEPTPLIRDPHRRATTAACPLVPDITLETNSYLTPHSKANPTRKLNHVTCLPCLYLPARSSIGGWGIGLDCWFLIAEFYLVDRGLRHRLPGFSSLDRLVVYLADRGLGHRLPGISSLDRPDSPPVVAPLVPLINSSNAKGHTTVAYLRGRLQAYGVGSNGIAPIALSV